jgi:hypothetical protein
MQVVPLESVATQRLENPRNGVFFFQRPLAGAEGSLENFSLELVRTERDFYSPRHRHNFDQVRFQLDGIFDFSRDGKMTPGKVGFFPEGTPYGPQKCPGPTQVLVLQFGGASGGGFMSKEQLHSGVQTLKQRGTVADGVFTWTDAAGAKRNKDSYEAVWEMVFGKPLIYPAARYERPFLMDPAHFKWTPTGEAGVSDKFLGSFTERKTTLRMLRLDEGARCTIRGNVIGFISAGSGRAGDDRYAPRTSIHVGAGEDMVVEAESVTEMLCIGIPPIDRTH